MRCLVPTWHESEREPTYIRDILFPSTVTNKPNNGNLPVKTDMKMKDHIFPTELELSHRSAQVIETKSVLDCEVLAFIRGSTYYDASAGFDFKNTVDRVNF